MMNCMKVVSFCHKPGEYTRSILEQSGYSSAEVQELVDARVAFAAA